MHTKEPSALAGRQTRWWKAPMRLPATTLSLLRQSTLGTTLGRLWPNGSWLEHTPAGIRAPAGAESQ